MYDRVLERLSRRDVLKLASFLGASLIRPETARGGQAPLYFNAYPFTMGVASGDPVADGVVLWTRLAPRPLEGGGMPMVPVPVQWEVGRDQAFRTIAQKGETLARPELGHSVHVEVAGLDPGREYWYRFRAGNEISQTGRTKTAPAAGAAVDQLRFGICGCSHYETGYNSTS
jgi:alkaline phosphatase D